MSIVLDIVINHTKWIWCIRLNGEVDFHVFVHLSFLGACPKVPAEYEWWVRHRKSADPLSK
jgi:hypothetical protein